MNDENFSIVDSKKNKKNLSNGIQLLIAFGANIVIYAMTYFYPSIVLYSGDSYDSYSDREVRRYILYALVAVGFYLCYNIIELYKQSRGESIEDGEAGIDAEFMGTYSYTTLQDKRWVVYVASAAGGAINVLLYLAFLGFVIK